MAVTLQQIKDEYAKELGYKNWADYCENVENMWTLPDIDEHVPLLAKRYAEACCKATLEKAAGNVRVIGEKVVNDMGNEIDVFGTVEKVSITNPSNIVLL